VAPQLAAQLEQLTALQRLTFSSVWCPAAQAHCWQPLVDCIVGMAGLRSLKFGGSLTNQQRAQLQAATQLTELHLQ
jgi:hypothetical protein